MTCHDGAMVLCDDFGLWLRGDDSVPHDPAGRGAWPCGSDFTTTAFVGDDSDFAAAQKADFDGLMWASDLV